MNEKILKQHYTSADSRSTFTLTRLASDSPTALRDHGDLLLLLRHLRDLLKEDLLQGLRHEDDVISRLDRRLKNKERGFY